MCEAKRHIKLCTCDPDAIPQDRNWSLTRGAESDMSVIGLFMHPSEMPPTFALLIDRIARDLNEHPCFDFPYEPTESDLLEINLEGRRYSFRCSNGKWTESLLPTSGEVTETGAVVTVEVRSPTTAPRRSVIERIRKLDSPY